MVSKKKRYLDLNISPKTIEKKIDEFKVKIPEIKPTKINLVCDATFFRKRKDKDVLLIFFDSISRQIVWHKFIQSETKENYLEGLNFLLEKGFKVLSVTIDGRRGIPVVFRKYPCLSVSDPCSISNLKKN